MGRVIAVANQKGGVGKSTTAINLSACLAEKGKKVLAIDIDPQGNTTSGLGVDKNNVENTLYELLLGEAEAKDTIVKDVVENVDLIPSWQDLLWRKRCYCLQFAWNRTSDLSASNSAVQNVYQRNF